MNSLAYNGSVYVIGANILSSWGDPNGESSIQWVKDRFYLFADGGVYTSTDGINWGPSSPVDSMLNGSVSAVKGGVFFTSGDSIYLIGGSTLAVSTDGTNFKSFPAPDLQSADGLHWQKVTPQLDTVVSYYNGVMYDSSRYYFTGVKNSGGFFTIATTDPTNTSSYGAMGGINPASGTSAVNYFPQFDDFIYHNGKYVGTVVSNVDGDSYLAFSTDGMNWTTDSLGGSGHGRTTVSVSDSFHIVAGDGGYYTVSFAKTAPPALLRFEAEAVRSFGGEDSRLRWEMKYDSTLAYFLVQHSQDTVHWDSIGRVNAEKRKEKEERNQNKSPTERYQFTQDGPPSGANYYRLGITDDEGHRWWSAVRKVEIKKDIYIYPNPARDVLHVQLPEPGRSRVSIFNRGWTPVREMGLAVCSREVQAA